MRGFLIIAFTLLLTSSVLAADNTTSVSDGDSDMDSNVSPVMCYKCNSHEDEDGEDCYDPFVSDKFTPITCPSGICVKYYQNVGVKDTTIKQINRDCAVNIEQTLLEKKKSVDGGGCVLSTGTKEVKVEICNCKSDNCNGVSSIRSASSTVFAAGLVCLLAKLLH